MATVESYFESLGRESTKPFLDETYVYAEKEPDLTQKVNANIDAEIKDTEKFFSNNITMFKDMLKVGGMSTDVKNLVGLTKSGGPIVADWFEFQDSLKKLDKLSNEETRIKFRSEGINVEEKLGKNLVELNKEIGRIEHDLDTKGYSTAINAEGEEVTINSSKELKKYQLMVQSLSTGNGRDTAAKSAKYYGKFLEIAKKDIPHVNGKYFGELELEQQIEWLRSIKAYYIKMWQEENPKFSDGLVVTRLMPAMDKQEISLFNHMSALDDQATEFILNEGVYKDYVNVINTQSSNSIRENSLTASEGLVHDAFYGEGGLYQKRYNYYLERYDGNKERALDALGKEMNKVFERAVNSGEIQKDAADVLFTEWTFPKKDGSGNTTFAEMNPRSAKIARNLENLLNDKVTAINETTLKNDLKTHRENLKENKFMTQEQFYRYIPYPDLYDEAKAIYEAGQRGGMTQSEFSGVNTDLSAAITKFASTEREAFGLSKKPSKNDDRDIINATNLVRPHINREFFKYYQLGKKNFQTELEARNWALEQTLNDIEQGRFKPGLVALADKTVELKNANVLGKKYSAIIGSSEQASKEWVNTNMAHDGEMPHLLAGREALLNNRPVPAIYRELAKAYDYLTPENLLYERLVATDLIEPTDKNFALYGRRLEPEVNIMESRLINNFPTMNKVIEYAALNTENWAEITDSVSKKETLPHFEGYGAFKASDTEGYSTEIDLREMRIFPEGDTAENVDTIVELFEKHPNARFGIFSMKGNDVADLIFHLKSKGLITGEEKFDDKFQIKLLMTQMKLNENKKLVMNGDTSYLSPVEIPEEDQKLYEKLTGKEGKNIPQWDRLEFLLPYIIRYKANTEL